MVAYEPRVNRGTRGAHRHGEQSERWELWEHTIRHSRTCVFPYRTRLAVGDGGTTGTCGMTGMDDLDQEPTG